MLCAELPRPVSSLLSESIRSDLCKFSLSCVCILVDVWLTWRYRGWSPLAGGALTGKLSSTTVEKGSRFDVTDPNNFIAHMYKDLYHKPSVFAVSPQSPKQNTS